MQLQDIGYRLRGVRLVRLQRCGTSSGGGGRA